VNSTLPVGQGEEESRKRKGQRRVEKKTGGLKVSVARANRLQEIKSTAKTYREWKPVACDQKMRKRSTLKLLDKRRRCRILNKKIKSR